MMLHVLFRYVYHQFKGCPKYAPKQPQEVDLFENQEQRETCVDAHSHPSTDDVHPLGTILSKKPLLEIKQMMTKNH